MHSLTARYNRVLALLFLTSLPVLAADYAADSFSRTASVSWGSTSPGGSYTLTSGYAYAVDGNAGLLDLPSAAKGGSSLLKGVTAQDVDITFRVRANDLPTGYGQIAYAIVRHISGNYEYRGRVRFSGGAVYLQASRLSGSGSEVNLGNEVKVAGLTVSTSRFTRVRVQATGLNPTTLRVKAWADGTSEPAGWQFQTTDSTTSLQKAGGVGVRAYLSSSTTNAPTRFYFDDLRAASATTASSTTSSTTVLQAPTSTYTGSGTVSIRETSYAYPTNALFVSTSGDNRNSGSINSPWRTIQHAVNSAASGSTIVIRGGTYREYVYYYGKQLTLQPYPKEQVWIKGSLLVTSWVSDGSAWRTDNWTHQLNRTSLSSDWIDPAYPLAHYPDMVFVNGQPLRQVGSRSAVSGATFFADYANKRVYIGVDPRGKSVEVTAFKQFYINAGHGSVVRGLGFMHYGNHVNDLGAVKGNASRLTFENNTFAWNAGPGLSILNADATVRGNTFVFNGQIGLHGNYSHRLLMEANTFAYNNYEHFKITSAQGGVKITRGRDMTWRGNLSESNFGRGMWCDLSCYNVKIVRNIVRRNLDRGIQYEISARAVIASNLVHDNGIDGIAVLESNDIDIYNNTLVRNKQHIRIIEGARTSTADPAIPFNVGDVVVRNNLLSNRNSVSVALMGVDDVNKKKTAEQMGVSANYNGYSRTSSTSPSTLVQWSRWPTSMLMVKTFRDFQALGQERNGMGFDSSTNPFFVDEAAGDFRLKSGSPAIGAGMPLPQHVADAIGKPAGVAVNLGALLW